MSFFEHISVENFKAQSRPKFNFFSIIWVFCQKLRKNGQNTISSLNFKFGPPTKNRLNIKKPKIRSQKKETLPSKS
jgi:hypothetical protein